MAANPYVQGWREWDDRYADVVQGSRNWQIVTVSLFNTEPPKHLV